MKVRMYIDFYGGVAQSGFYATTNPNVKPFGAKRLAFDLHIPDDMLYEPDRIAVEVGKVEVVVDHNEGES